MNEPGVMPIVAPGVGCVQVNRCGSGSASPPGWTLRTMRPSGGRGSIGTWGVAALVVAPFGSSPSGMAAPGKSPAVDQVLDQYERALDRFDHCRFRMSESIRCISPVIPPDAISEHRNFRVWRDGTARFRITFSRIYTKKEGGKTIRDQQGHEISIIGTTKTQVTWFDPKAKERYVNTWLDCMTEEDRTGDIYSYPYGTVLNGHMQWTKQPGLVALLRKGNPRAISATLGGKEVVRVDGKTEWGKTSIWLDPGRGCLPLRITHSKGVDDLIVPGKTLGSINSEKDTTAPQGKRVRIDYAVDVDYGTGQDVGPTITMGDVETERYESGQTRKFMRDITVTDLDFGPIPDKEFAIATRVPDGTEVRVENHLNLLYEWRGGRVVKVGVAEPVETPTVVTSGRWWRWLVGAVVCAAAIGIAWLSYGRLWHRRPTP